MTHPKEPKNHRGNFWEMKPLALEMLHFVGKHPLVSHQVESRVDVSHLFLRRCLACFWIAPKVGPPKNCFIKGTSLAENGPDTRFVREHGLWPLATKVYQELRDFRCASRGESLSCNRAAIKTRGEDRGEG